MCVYVCTPDGQMATVSENLVSVDLYDLSAPSWFVTPDLLLNRPYVRQSRHAQLPRFAMNNQRERERSDSVKLTFRAFKHLLMIIAR